ncbi:OmpA family protein [Desulfovibrio sp. OttesenSCG-928-G15]|nr:OmpA family protein [Desulfovibrio sp. OttesenSCG-928-G15]
MKRISLFAMVAVMLTAFAATAMAAEPLACSSPKVQSFDILADYSGSMMMKHKHLAENKMKLTKQALQRINDRIPELGYTGSIHTFSPAKEVLAQQTYNREVFAKGINKLSSTYDVYNRLTRMGDGIRQWSDKVYQGLPTPTAVIVASDGESNRGEDVLAACQSAMAANPDLTFHVLDASDSEHGHALLNSISNLNPGKSVNVPIRNILDHNEVADKFVRDVFCAEGGITLRSIQFALNSAKLNRDSTAVLDELANVLRQSNRNITISGHTCSLGSAAYNQRLSERRAASVKSYLVKQGIPANTMSTVGYGKTRPKFDNSTDEGRRMNRRAEVDFN